MGVHMRMHMSAHEVYICFCSRRLLMYIPAYLSACLLTYLPTDLPTYLLTDLHAYMQTSMDAYIHIHLGIRTHAYLRVHACILLKALLFISQYHVGAYPRCSVGCQGLSFLMTTVARIFGGIQCSSAILGFRLKRGPPWVYSLCIRPLDTSRFVDVVVFA